MSALLEVALAAAFIGGLAGGVHCAGMCGGIVHALCCAPGTGAPPQLTRPASEPAGPSSSFTGSGS